MTKIIATQELLDAYIAEATDKRERKFRMDMRRFYFANIQNRNYTDRVIDFYNQWKSGKVSAGFCVDSLR